MSQAILLQPVSIHMNRTKRKMFIWKKNVKESDFTITSAPFLAFRLAAEINELKSILELIN